VLVCGRKDVEWDVFAKGTLMIISLAVLQGHPLNLTGSYSRALRLIALRGFVKESNDIGLLTLLTPRNRRKRQDLRALWLDKPPNASVTSSRLPHRWSREAVH
jgi:hypothetical protein